MRLGDFEFAAGRVGLPKTGNSARLDRVLLVEVAIWLTYQLLIRLRARLSRAARRERRAIWFTPDRPHPRYMVRAAAMWAGVRVADAPSAADAAFFFDDATVSDSPEPGVARHYNFGCGDISKSRVATVFESVFGYALGIDPRSWNGAAVEKSEINGAHDGRIVDCPREPLPGCVYQRLVDAVGTDGLAEDLRTHCIGGGPVVVWVKRRVVAGRFLPPNLTATRHAPATIFSVGELARITAFVAAMGADWCALDVLRDRSDGRIYIVDVNKTDAGPITALPMRDKLASTALLADALLRLIAMTPQPGGSRVTAVSTTSSSFDASTSPSSMSLSTLVSPE